MFIVSCHELSCLYIQTDQIQMNGIKTILKDVKNLKLGAEMSFQKIFDGNLSLSFGFNTQTASSMIKEYNNLRSSTEIYSLGGSVLR